MAGGGGTLSLNTYLVVVGGLLLLLLLFRIGSGLSLGFFTLRQVRGQMGVCHLQTARLGVNRSHLKRERGRLKRCPEQEDMSSETRQAAVAWKRFQVVPFDWACLSVHVSLFDNGSGALQLI